MRSFLLLCLFSLQSPARCFLCCPCRSPDMWRLWVFDLLRLISGNCHFWRMILSGILGLDFGFFSVFFSNPRWLASSFVISRVGTRTSYSAGDPLKLLVWVYRQYSSRDRMIMTRENDRWAEQIPGMLNCSRAFLVTLCNCIMWPSYDCFYSVFSYMDSCTQFLNN